MQKYCQVTSEAPAEQGLVIECLGKLLYASSHRAPVLCERLRKAEKGESSGGRRPHP